MNDLLERDFEEAIGAYWDCAYQEGHLQRPDGNKANAILHEIRGAVKALVEAERDGCLALAHWHDHGDLTTVGERIRKAIRERRRSE